MLMSPSPEGAQQGQQAGAHGDPVNADQTEMRAQHATGEPAKEARNAVSHDGLKRLTSAAQPTTEMLRQQGDADRVVRGKRQCV